MKKLGARLGQHFLTGQWAATRLAQSIYVREDETILEIGPGKGALTRELLATGASVIAVEKDEALAEHLQNIFSEEIDSGKLKIITGDIRDITAKKMGLKKYVVAANIPYYITGEIIRQFLATNVQPRAMVLLIQKEVAERIIARDGKESILSLSVKAYGIPKMIAKVSRGNFFPPPSVDSAILLIENISRKSFSNISEDVFFKVVHAGFAAKRKFLSSNLAVVFDKEKISEAFTQLDINEKIRAEDMQWEKWGRLATKLPPNRGRAQAPVAGGVGVF